MEREIRNRLDEDPGCPACGAPSAVQEFRYNMDDGQSTDWRIDRLECGAECWKQDLDRYNNAVARLTGG